MIVYSADALLRFSRISIARLRGLSTRAAERFLKATARGRQWIEAAVDYCWSRTAAQGWFAPGAQRRGCIAKKGISVASLRLHQPDAAPVSVNYDRDRIASEVRPAAADPVEMRSPADELSAAYALLAHRFPDETFSHGFLLAVGSARKRGAGLVVALAGVLIAMIIVAFAT
jgi:hypothetical protein